MQFIREYIDNEEILVEIYQTIFSFLTEKVVVVYDDTPFRYMLHSFYTLNINNELVLPKHPKAEFYIPEHTLSTWNKEWKDLPQISNKMANRIIRDIYFQIS